MGDKVFDLDALADEADPFTFTFGGQEFTFPADPDIVALEFFDKGDFQNALFVLLGDEDYQRMDAIPATTARMGHARFAALMEAYGRHLGVEPGKSSGPSKSARLARSARQVR